jgi:hypothetical protein
MRSSESIDLIFERKVSEDKPAGIKMLRVVFVVRFINVLG